MEGKNKIGGKKSKWIPFYSSTLLLHSLLSLLHLGRGSVVDERRGERVSGESLNQIGESGGGVLLLFEEEEDDSRPRASVVEEDGSWSLDDDDFDVDVASIDPSFLCSDDDDVLRAGVFHRGVPPDGRGPLASRGGEVHLVPGMTIKLETKL